MQQDLHDTNPTAARDLEQAENGIASSESKGTTQPRHYPAALREVYAEVTHNATAVYDTLVALHLADIWEGVQTRLSERSRGGDDTDQEAFELAIDAQVCI